MTAGLAAAAALVASGQVDVARTVTSGSLLLALPVAIAAGVVSFLSPCVLPLVPGYLSYVTGMVGADLADARRGRVLLGSTLFVLGFTAVFVSLGLAFGSNRTSIDAGSTPASKRTAGRPRFGASATTESACSRS